MTHKKKIEWMALWAAKNDVKLDLKGEVGFGRECVGISRHEIYPDYNWYDKKTWNRIDKNGEVWTPENAYHKHPCVAVLGRGKVAEEQLYDWLKWFDDNGFIIESGDVPRKDWQIDDPVLVMVMGQDRYARMVKK
jgi:hypothetical protein